MEGDQEGCGQGGSAGPGRPEFPPAVSGPVPVLSTWGDWAVIESLGSRAQNCQMKGNQLCSCDGVEGVSTQVQGALVPTALLFSLSGEPR